MVVLTNTHAIPKPHLAPLRSGRVSAGAAMEKYLLDNFDLPAKNPSEEAQRRWRSAVGSLVVKNRRRRFRHVPDLDQRHQDHAKRRSVQVLALLGCIQPKPPSSTTA